MHFDDYITQQRTRSDELGDHTSSQKHVEHLCRFVNWVSNHVGGFVDKSIIDCGTREGTLLDLVEARGADPQGIVGFELLPEIVEVGKAAGRDVREADMRYLLAPDDSADVVFCSHVLEHLPDPMAGIREMKRVCDPGGYLAIAVPVEATPNKELAHNYAFPSEAILLGMLGVIDGVVPVGYRLAPAGSSQEIQVVARVDQ